MPLEPAAINHLRFVVEIDEVLSGDKPEHTTITVQVAGTTHSSPEELAKGGQRCQDRRRCRGGPSHRTG